MKRYQLTTPSSRLALFVLPAFFLAGTAVATWTSHGVPTARADGSNGIAGVWIGTNAAGEHFVQTISSDAEGNRTTFNGGSVNTIYGSGLREAMAGTQGESVRIAPDVYRFRAVDYSVFEDADRQDHIATIIVFEGVTTFDVPNGTAISSATVTVYDASADGDNDGLPDPGAPSLVAFPADFTLKRLGT